MGASVGRIARGVAAGAVLGTLAFFTVSKDARERLDAAKRAFGDPTLLSNGGAAPAGVAEPLPAITQVSELKISGEFAPLPDDAEDADTSVVRTLVMPDLRVPITRRTMRYVRLFTKTESGRQAFLARYRRAGAYREIIERALRDAGLPEDLTWVAAIESSFDPRTVSPKGAAGLWQFMPETGATYGLYQSPYVDDRMNPVASSRAAVAHLRDLYERFGRWDLALASYNMGYAGVLGAVEKYLASPASQGRRPSAPVELSELAEAKVIPEETANYVPQIHAFAIVAANRSRFGLDIASLAPAQPLDLGEISVPEGTRLRTIARAAGMSTSSLRDYNPHLLRDRTPPAGGDFILYVPADRVQRALISFPAFADNEVLVDEVDDAFDRDAPPDPMAGPQPARPRNRLPVFSVPGQDAHELIGPAMAFASFNAKLPVVTVGGDLGWRRPASNDAFSILTSGAGVRAPAKGREVVLEVAAAALGPKVPEPLAPSDRFTLPSGVTVEIVQEPNAALVAITTRIAGGTGGSGDAKADLVAALRGVTPSETRYTATVAPRSLEVGLDLAVRRLRLALGDDDAGAALRRAASAPYRHDLAATPAGSAWLALGDTLFPKGHALEGAIVSGRADTALYCDLFLADEMRRERAPRRATITIAGDVTRSRVEKALASAVLASSGADQEIAPHPRADRVTVEAASRRLIYGWIGPAEGQAGHAALRVAIEILAGAKSGRLKKALGEENALATEITGLVEPSPRAAVAAIEIVPSAAATTAAVVLTGPAAGTGGADVTDAIEERLDAEIAALGEQGPTVNEVALAKALISGRIERARKAAQPAQNGKGAAGGGALAASALPSAARVMLDPAAYDRILSQLNEVAPNAVKLAVKRLLQKDHRVVVVAGPKKLEPQAP